jgi:hypothetical protein
VPRNLTRFHARHAVSQQDARDPLLDVNQSQATVPSMSMARKTPPASSRSAALGARSRPPILRSNVGDVLREGPPVTRMIANAVLPLAKWHVRRRLHNQGPELPRSLEMLVDISDRDVHIPTHRGSIRCTVRPALTAKHDRAFTDGELCVAYHAVPLSPEPLRKAERPAQPMDGLPNVAVYQYRNHCGRWC